MPRLHRSDVQSDIHGLIVPHTTHRAGGQWSVQQVGSRDEVLLFFQVVQSWAFDHESFTLTNMRMPAAILEAELLQLPKADRIGVLDRIVDSLDAQAARDAARDAVAAQRDAEAARDPSVLLDLDDVLARLRAQVQ